MSNVIIIGNGPAGISASLYIKRAGIETTIIGKDYGALSKASEIENYYGFSDPIPGTVLVENGIAGAKRLGVEFITDEVLSITYEEKLTVVTKSCKYEADSIIIATGSSRTTPKINGLAEFEGRGISYCAVCDAFFYKNLHVAVLGNGEYALHEALVLSQTSASVTILTNGLEPTTTIPNHILVNKNPIDSFTGTNILEEIHFSNGETLSVSGLFIALGVAGSTALARTLGAAIDNNKIVVDEHMSTTIPGIFAAGDCTGGFLQISKAVYEGAKAGTEVIRFLKNI